MANWIQERYPIGRIVEAAEDDYSLHRGKVSNHTVEGSTINGIMVQFEKGGWNEYEAEFLSEDGNSFYVHTPGWTPPKTMKNPY